MPAAKKDKAAAKPIFTLAQISERIEYRFGDSLAILKRMPTNSISSIVTDPPYELGFMGKKWDATGIANNIDLWREALRVLKPGGHLVAFSGTRTYHRMACAIEDAGFEVRDMIQWLYGQGFPKSTNVSLAIDKSVGAVGHLAKSFNMKGGGPRADEFEGNGRDFSKRHNPKSVAAKQWEGWGTALKPANEPVCLARKPLSEDTVAANVLRWGTGALNIECCRVDSESRPLIDRRKDEALDATRNTYGAGIHGSKNAGETMLGRWPANVGHDGSEEVIAAFPNTTGGAFPSKRGAGGIATATDAGSASRFFYTAKADKADRAGSNHPTVKPVDLMRWLCRLITPPHGIVLDMFAGSGTTGEAAFLEGLRSIMIERDLNYQTHIKARMLRLASAAPLSPAPPKGRKIYGQFADENGARKIR